jgi:hypothetical protein
MARVNFADPSYEPSDADLDRLMSEAFRDVGRNRRAATDAMWREIVTGGAELLARYEERLRRLRR